MPVIPDTTAGSVGDNVGLDANGRLPAIDGSQLLNLPGFQGDRIISGGASWDSGLTFNVSTLVYVINNTQYTSPAGQVTLATAHATLDRIDVIYATSSSTVAVLTGTPSVSPIKPDLSTSTQIEVTFAYVSALATVPQGVAVSLVYLENTGTGGGEWNASTAAPTRINVASTVNPYQGTKDIEATNAVNNDYVLLDFTTGFETANQTNLEFALQAKSTWNDNNYRLQIQLYSPTGYPLGVLVDVKHGQFGFDRTNTSTYQIVSIPRTLFAIATTQVRYIVIWIRNTFGFYLDRIRWQTGINYPVSSSTDANAIHKNVANEISSITVKASPVGADLLLIEDSAASNVKKRITVSSLPAPAPAAHASTHLPGGTDALTTAAPGAAGVATASAVGVAASFARSDHAHQSNTAPVNVTKAAAAIGTSGEPARADHKHDVTTASAGANPPGTASAEGVATTMARSDHAHALAAFGTTASTFCQGNDSRLSDARTPTAHATTHQNGGTDEVATATAAANAIPKAGAGGTLAAPWLPTMVGDSGAGGTKGAAPAPAAGDTAAGKFLKADGTWSVPPGSSVTASTFVTTPNVLSDALTQAPAVTGTIAVTNGAATVTGTGTLFTTELAVFQTVFFSSSSVPRVPYTILSIASNTSLTLASNFAGVTIASGGSLQVPRESDAYIVGASPVNLWEVYAQGDLVVFGRAALTGTSVCTVGGSTVTAGSTTIAAPSNGAALPQATINVASTATFPTSGTIYVMSNTGLKTITYTGTSATTFTGCTGGTGTMATGGLVRGVTQFNSPTTTITAASNGAALPQATINIASTADFPPSGKVRVTTGAGVQVVTYTGIGSATTLTGCSGGTGTMSTGGAVTGQGEVAVGMYLEFSSQPTSMYQVSAIASATSLTIASAFTGVSATTIAAASNGVALPQATINVAATANFPTTGVVYVTTTTGIQAVYYTGIGSATTFTGCSGGTGTMATGNNVSHVNVANNTMKPNLASRWVRLQAGTGSAPADGLAVVVAAFQGTPGGSFAGKTSQIATYSGGWTFGGAPSPGAGLFVGGNGDPLEAAAGAFSPSKNKWLITAPTARVVSALSTPTTTSINDVRIPDVVSLPSAGTYEILFTFSFSYSAAATANCTMYNGGVEDATSQRTGVCPSATHNYSVATQSYPDLNGVQLVEAKWSVSVATTTLTAGQRTLTIRRVA